MEALESILMEDEKFMIWYSGQEEKQLRLSSVTEVIRGQKTVNFQKDLQPDREAHSFSLIYADGKCSILLGVDGSNSSHSVPVSRLGNNLNVLEDISWEHKDVYPGTKSAEVSITSLVDSLKILALN